MTVFSALEIEIKIYMIVILHNIYNYLVEYVLLLPVF